MASHVLTIDGWRPVSLNHLLKSHWAKRGRRKRHDRDMVALHALAQRVPQATGRRRISVLVEGIRRLPDPDNLLKSLLDAAVACGLLVDDSGEWCELGDIEVTRGKTDRTVITLEDL